MKEEGTSNARKDLGGVLAIVAGGLLVLGSILPWIRVSIPNSGETLWRSGTASVDGLLFLAGGLAVAALGLWTFFGHPSAGPAILIGGGLALGTGALLKYRDVAQAIEGVSTPFPYSVGEGIWVLFAGALVSLIAGIVLWGQMEPAPGADASGAIGPQGVSGRAVVVVLLIAVIILGVSLSNWPLEGFSWCPPDLDCFGGLEIYAT